MMTARGRGQVVCRSCGEVEPMGRARCPRCGEYLDSRDETSIEKVWAWLLVGLIAYIPANLYPMLLTTQVFRTEEQTIVGGVVELIHYGSYAVAGIVFFASVVIPVGKFIVIGYLAVLMSRPRHTSDPHRLLVLLEVVEFIGRWSMIDVFVVAILSALVQFDVLATINPGIAAVCFALSVIFTMLAAQSFDSRLIWDRMKDDTQGAPGHV